MICESIDTELAKRSIQYRADNDIPEIKDVRMRAAIRKKREHLEVDIEAQTKIAIDLIHLEHPDEEVNEWEIQTAIRREAEKHFEEVIRGVVEDYGKVKKSRIKRRPWGKKFNIGDMIMYDDGLIEEVKSPCRGKIKQKHSLLPSNYKMVKIKVKIGELRVAWFKVEGRIVVESFEQKRQMLLQMQKEGYQNIVQFLKRKVFQAAFDGYTKEIIVRYPDLEDWTYGSASETIRCQMKSFVKKRLLEN